MVGDRIQLHWPWSGEWLRSQKDLSSLYLFEQLKISRVARIQGTILRCLVLTFIYVNLLKVSEYIQTNIIHFMIHFTNFMEEWKMNVCVQYWGMKYILFWTWLQFLQENGRETTFNLNTTRSTNTTHISVKLWRYILLNTGIAEGK